MTRIASVFAIIIASGSIALEPEVAPRMMAEGFAPGSAEAAEDPAVVRKKFEDFVSGWMDRLRERERFNASKVKWKPAGAGVEAVYVGYDTANFRILPISNMETTPIGKIVYLELTLRLAGEDETAARTGQPQIIDRVEVTELFRYSDGKWVY